jgi:hypothetical protein
VESHTTRTEAFVLGLDVVNLQAEMGIAVIADRTVYPSLGAFRFRIFEDLDMGVACTEHGGAGYRPLQSY